MTPPVALTVSGTDPTGCRGIEADLKAFAAHQLHGMCVVTAAGGPAEMYPLPQTSVGGQLSVALNHLKPAAVKVGMLGNAENAAAVAARARAGDLPNLVLDPILDTMTGYRRGVVAAMMRLIPFASVITPQRRGGLRAGRLADRHDGGHGRRGRATGRARREVRRHHRRHARAVAESIDAVWTPGGVRVLHGRGSSPRPQPARRRLRRSRPRSPPSSTMRQVSRPTRCPAAKDTSTGALSGVHAQNSRWDTRATTDGRWTTFGFTRRAAPRCAESAACETGAASSCATRPARSR